MKGLANYDDSDANMSNNKSSSSSRAEHRQHKDNKQASNNQYLDRLVDGWLEGVKVEECK
jgi:hypothetical protein